MNNLILQADLTGFQMLKLFAQLRGITFTIKVVVSFHNNTYNAGVPESQLDVQVKRWLTILGKLSFTCSTKIN